MVRAPIAPPSRVASSAAGSVARDILKKREKPYKTEYQKVIAKKRKLNLNTSYRDAPEGYTFLAVGTPDLADLCKKLSKQRDLPVNVVNTKPTNRMATDPTKLSHHVHRIGYHFHSEVVEQAVAELNYILHKGQFVKEEDLAKKRQDGLTAQILLKHGIRMNDKSSQESHDQVRAAIKELFPKIPEDDLEQIVKHAWAEGTGRVGSVQTLDLPRRVQLAVIARIRHKYTDYDQLLRAFEWKEARRMTEPISLQKLIEWRGEQDVDEDDQLEEMVRETIVIDDDGNGDDSETMANGSEADDEDSAAEQGDNSDASIEVTHHLADDTDIGGESTYEGRSFALRRFQQVPRRSQRQQNVARQKLAEAYQQRRLRAAGAPTIPNIQTVQVPHRGPDGGFQMGGVVYQPIQQPQYSPAQHPPRQQLALYASQPAPRAALASGVTYRPSLRHPPPPQDRPVASIERDGGNSNTPTGNNRMPGQGQVYRRPITPDQSAPSKRRRVDERPPYLSNGNHTIRAQPFTGEVVDLTTPEQPRRRPLMPHNGELVNLMTPEPPYQSAHPSPLRDVRTVPFEYGRVEPQRHYQQFEHIAPPRQPSPMRISPQLSMQANDGYQDEPEDLAYDPRQPMLHLPQQVDRLSIRPEQHHRSPYNNMPGAYPPSPVHFPSQPPPPQPLQYYEVPQQPNYQQSFQPQQVYAYPPAPPPRILYEQQQPSRPTPQPIHGAPAPVQVVPRHAPHLGYGRPPTVPPPLPPTDGAPAPVQVWNPR